MVCVDPAYQDECKIGEIAEVFDTEKAYETNETLAALRYLVMKRKLAIVTDANTFQDAQCTAPSVRQPPLRSSRQAHQTSYGKSCC